MESFINDKIIENQKALVAVEGSGGGTIEANLQKVLFVEHSHFRSSEQSVLPLTR